MEFERILSASGPTGGHIARPSDGKEPKKIAWLQCVGSRDVNKCSNEYCSSVCCMYAVKEAVMAKEHVGDDYQSSIFYMDMRTSGKEFERYYNRAKDEGVRFIRSRVHSISEIDPSGTLKLTYISDAGETIDEDFDMVVLSVGMESADSAIETANTLGIELNTYNFIKTDTLSPVATSKPGIYVAGVLQGPKDIPQSVTEASAAACSAALSLNEARGSLVKEREFPEELNIEGQEPRVGVFVCKCGINIAGYADVSAIKEHAENLPGVVYAEETLFACSQDSQEKLIEVIKENNLNRIVVAACTPTTHEPLFQETMRDAGLNPYLFDMANIRNQCTWVHSDDKDVATNKAKDLVSMSVARAAKLEPLNYLEVEVGKPVMVIGGGVAGLTAAHSLAEQGFKTTIVEKSDSLGGTATKIKKTWQGQDIQTFLSDLVKNVQDHDDIDVLLNSEVSSTNGFVGNFETEVTSGDITRTVKHGAVIVATGGTPAGTDEYLYGKSDRVTRWHDLENDPEKLKSANSVAFIQCVGSRDDNRPYCSKICCTATISQAISVKEQNPEAHVVVLYRDIRTYGEREALYTEARRKGVIFIRYSLDKKPAVVETANGLEITAFDPILQKNIVIEADLLNLATAIEPSKSQTVSQSFKLPVNEDGFFMEAHAKLRPVDCSTDGVFLCGLAHYPKPIEETIAQATAAVARAVNVLSKKTFEVEPIVSEIDQETCIGCGICLESCSFSAIESKAVEGKGYRAHNVSALCKGCGVCAAACPQQAITMKHFNDDQIIAAIKAGISAA
jgi:heterodisulfide reductase subunit A